MQLMSIKIGLLSVLLLKTCVRKKGGLGGFAPQTLTRSYYFEPPLSKKRSRATGHYVFTVRNLAVFNLFGGAYQRKPNETFQRLKALCNNLTAVCKKASD